MTSNNAAIAYNDLRRALLAPDTMVLDGLTELATRVEQAACKYPDDHPAQRAENAVLRAYKEYLDAVACEAQMPHLVD